MESAAGGPLVPAIGWLCWVCCTLLVPLPRHRPSLSLSALSLKWLVHLTLCSLLYTLLSASFISPPPSPPVGFYFSSEFCINLFVCNVVTLMSATLFVCCCFVFFVFFLGGLFLFLFFCLFLFCLCVCVFKKKIYEK